MSQKNLTFAAGIILKNCHLALMAAIEVDVSKKLKHISAVISSLLNVMQQTESSTDTSVVWSVKADNCGLLFALLKLYKASCEKEIIASNIDSFSDLIEFSVADNEANKIISQIEDSLACKDIRVKSLKVAISYLFDELICNIQQHAQVATGFIYTDYNKECDCIDICLADQGVTIYGSYVQSGKYLDYIGNNAAEALNMAKDGYSTKNRPDAENRGYGISSNVKMITEGLNGTFAMLSGNALMINLKEKMQVASLPIEIEWPGTCIIIRIPLDRSSNFNLYDYIS